MMKEMPCRDSSCHKAVNHRNVRTLSAESVRLRSVGYDQATRTLEVEQLDGALYQYCDVPKQMHERLMRTRSKGRFLDAKIKPRYPYSQVG